MERVLQLYNLSLKTGRGERQCVEHDSLFVNEQKQVYTWFSSGPDHEPGEGGDIFRFVGNREHCDDKAAAEWICRRLNLPAPSWSGENVLASVVIRERKNVFEVAAKVFVKWLKTSPDAIAYAHNRGWTDETIQTSRLGFSGTGTPQEREELVAEFKRSGLDPQSPAAVAILGMKGGIEKWLNSHDFEPEDSPFADWVEKGYISGMLGHSRLIFPHILPSGEVNYLSCRAIEGKYHYNLHNDLAGIVWVYFNSAYKMKSDNVFVVEGQADAVSLAQMGYPAVALCGLGGLYGERPRWANDHKNIYLALDQDKAGISATQKSADVLGPMTRILKWDIPKHQVFQAGDGELVPVKDANDLLKAFTQDNVEPDQQKAIIYGAMQQAPTYVEERCAAAGRAEGAERDEAVKGALLVIARMDDLSLSQYRSKLSKSLGVGLRDLDHMLKTATAKKEDLGEPVYTYGGYFPATGWLVEYLYDPKFQQASLAWRDDQGNIGSGDSLVMDGQKYLPYPVNETIRSGAVSFPSKLGEEKSLRELITIAEIFIKTHYLLPSDKVARMMAYYVMMTWIYDAFNSLMYLRAMGDAGSGKSEMMRRVGLLCYRMMTANGAGSTSAMFRMVERYKGTVFIDEADLSNSDTASDMVKFINLGAMKGNPILRTVEVTGPNGNKDFEEKAFQTFCPKLIAQRKDFIDDAVGTRCLTFPVQPREQIELRRAGIPNEINNSMREQALAIRNMFLRWRLKNWLPEIEVNPDFYDLQISTRLNQVAGPLLQLAAEDPIQQEEIRKNLRDYYLETILDRSMTISARVIEAIWKIMKYDDLRSNKEMVRVDEDGVFWLKTNAVTAIANQLIKEMNGGSDDDDDEDDGKGKRRKSKELTSHGIGRLMRKELQLRMSERRRDGFWVMYDETRMEGLSMRYGIKPEELGPVESPAKKKPEATQGVLA